MQAMRAALASTVLTKGAGFVFGDLGFFQDEIDLCMSDKDEAFGFPDVSHCGGLVQNVLQCSIKGRLLANRSERA